MSAHARLYRCRPSVPLGARTSERRARDRMLRFHRMSGAPEIWLPFEHFVMPSYQRAERSRFEIPRLLPNSRQRRFDPSSRPFSSKLDIRSRVWQPRRANLNASEESHDRRTTTLPTRTRLRVPITSQTACAPRSATRSSNVVSKLAAIMNVALPQDA
jgi:hypothetical protein